MKVDSMIIVLLISFVIGYVVMFLGNKWRKRPLTVTIYGFFETILITYIINYHYSNKKLDYAFVGYVVFLIIAWFCFYKYIKKEIKDCNEIEEDTKKIKEEINKL